MNKLKTWSGVISLFLLTFILAGCVSQITHNSSRFQDMSKEQAVQQLRTSLHNVKIDSSGFDVPTTGNLYYSMDGAAGKTSLSYNINIRRLDFDKVTRIGIRGSNVLVMVGWREWIPEFQVNDPKEREQVASAFLVLCPNAKR